MSKRKGKIPNRGLNENLQKLKFEYQLIDGVPSSCPFYRSSSMLVCIIRTRLTYNCAHLRSTKKSLTTEYFEKKIIFWVKSFWAKIFCEKIFCVKNCLGEYCLGEIFLGEIVLADMFFWLKIFQIKIFWVQIFLGENFGVTIFLGQNFGVEIF